MTKLKLEICMHHRGHCIVGTRTWRLDIDSTSALVVYILTLVILYICFGLGIGL